MTQYKNLLLLFIFLNIPITTGFTTHIEPEGNITHITIFRDNTFVQKLSLDLHFQYNIANNEILKPIDHAIATDHYLITHSNTSSVYDIITHPHVPPPTDLISIWDLATGKNINAISIPSPVQSIHWNQTTNSITIVHTDSQVPDSQHPLQSLIAGTKFCDGRYKNDAIITLIPPPASLFTLSRCSMIVVTLVCLYAIYKFIQTKKDNAEIDNNNEVLTSKAIIDDPIQSYNNTEITTTDSI